MVVRQKSANRTHCHAERSGAGGEGRSRREVKELCSEPRGGLHPDQDQAAFNHWGVRVQQWNELGLFVLARMDRHRGFN